MNRVNLCRYLYYKKEKGGRRKKDGLSLSLSLPAKPSLPPDSVSVFVSPPPRPLSLSLSLSLSRVLKICSRVLTTHPLHCNVKSAGISSWVSLLLRGLKGYSTMNNTKTRNLSGAAISMVFVITTLLSHGYTDERDVYAINSLYAALGLPLLPGWIPNGGDPCLESWQGVQCVGSNITAIILNGANLGGQLGDKLENFTSIITIELSNNNIGGRIPENLPITMQNFFLSANQLTGSIPSSLSKLTLLSAMSLNNNHLTGELPDAFQFITDLINLDLSSNNLSGQLPPSMESLSSLTTLHLQNNQISGTLDVLQDLPLKDLNIENNTFSGPIPEKLLNIPNFKRDGNPFNTTITPSPTPLPPPEPPLSGPPVPQVAPTNFSDGSAAQNSAPPARKNSISTIMIIIFAVVAVVVVIVAVLLVIFCMSKCQERKSKHGKLSIMEGGGVHGRLTEPRSNAHLIVPNNEVEESIPKEAAKEPKKENEIDTTRAVPREASETKEHAIDMRDAGIVVMPPPAEKVTVNPVVPPRNVARNTHWENVHHPTSVASFSVASLQQYTNSFREENMIRDGRLGKVYLAELPDGKLLAVMKLDDASSKLPVDEFLELVLSISELKHPNILELVGYCAEFGQRLLVYKYFSKTTLHDVLHCGDNLKWKLSWNERLQVALGAAKSLEYLHEGCQPPVIHQNFETANILLNSELAVRVSECGMESLMSSNSVTQLSGRMRALFSYEAPEVNESGLHTDRSDVYSFGVVMLELLTGRMPHDSSRPRAEQHLVRWASSQLHDIDALSRMVDPSIDRKYPEKLLSRFADIISRCIQQGPEFRPAMSEVVQDLTRMVENAREGVK